MRKLVAVLMGLGLIVGLSGMAMAGNSAQQTVTYEVQAINELSASGDPAALVVNAAVAGSAPTEVSNALTTYAITTNESSKKITGKINTAMGSGLTLKVNLAAPTGGTSAGDVSLSATDQDLVTGITKLNESGKTITYKFSATSDAGVISEATKTVTFTITDGT